MTNNSIEAVWEGPFNWPLLRGQGTDLPDSASVYLFTVPYKNGGYAIYLAGQTEKPLHKRLKEHANLYRNGIHTIFDMEAMQNGEKKFGMVCTGKIELLKNLKSLPAGEKSCRKLFKSS